MAERSHAQSDNIDLPESSATASTHEEKQEKNIVIKTVHTIRDKVVGFTGDVKEKAHNLMHSDKKK